MRQASLDPFQSLSSAEIEATAIDAGAAAGPQPVSPVPPEASVACFRHYEFGEPALTWTYRDARGRVLGHVARFETTSGKTILPRTWCRLPDGRYAWRWKALAAPRPLYGLDRLAARPEAPVLLVEGEATADAAQRHFPSHVAITWPGGANAVAMADWSVLAGRSVVLWPDADAIGRKAMGEVAKHSIRAGAVFVREVDVPDDLPAGWDLANAVPADISILDLLSSARPCAQEPELPPGYSLGERGLIWCDPSDEDKPELLLAGSFQVRAETRDTDGNSWGVLLEWRDHDGRPHRLPLPRATLAGDGTEARRALLDGGLYVAPSRAARERLTAFLASVRSGGRVTATNRIGWHEHAFVLPDHCFGAGSSEDLMIQGASASEHCFRVRGTLPEWQKEVAAYAAGNSRLVVSISAAFAACLVGPCEMESGGLHFRGASSIGKTTALAVAGSVWGGSEPSGYIKSWRSTANGLEGIALAHCDALLCLDELSQVPPRDAGEVAYMLANGSGKHRSTRDGSARRAARWRLLFLSSGEIGLSDKVAEEGRGRRLTAGQQVRVVDIPADPGAGFGLFEELHDFPSAEALAKHMRSSASRLYGSAARAFLPEIVTDLAGVRSFVSAQTEDFVRRYVPIGADGQVHRVAQRFALIAAAGERAVTVGVLPWSQGEATSAAARVYQDWLATRGGIEPAEIRTGISQVRAFLLAHGMSRFVDAWENRIDRPMAPRDIAGYRKREGDGWDYYITTCAWRNEVCCGLDRQAVAQQLADRGMLMLPATGLHRAKSVSVPGHGKLRLYHIPAWFLEDDRED